MAKIGKVIADTADVISDAIRNFSESGKAGKAVSTLYDKIVRPVGKAAGNTTLKVGASTMEATADTVDFFRRNKETFKKIGSNAVEGTVREAATLGKAAFGLLELGQKVGILESTADNLGKSMVGIKLTANAKIGSLALAAGVGLIAGGRESLQNRQGRNDGQIYSPTPSMTNPYAMSQQMAYSQIGHSFADNAGADGDLVRAISGMR